MGASWSHAPLAGPRYRKQVNQRGLLGRKRGGIISSGMRALGRLLYNWSTACRKSGCLAAQFSVDQGVFFLCSASSFFCLFVDQNRRHLLEWGPPSRRHSPCGVGGRGPHRLCDRVPNPQVHRHQPTAPYSLMGRQDTHLIPPRTHARTFTGAGSRLWTGRPSLIFQSQET